MAIQHVAQRKPTFAQNFRYRVKDWESIFVEALQNTSFEGVTVCIVHQVPRMVNADKNVIRSLFQGPVRFYNNERKSSFLLNQFQFGEWVKIGEYNALYNRLDLTLGSPIKWVSIVPLIVSVLCKIFFGEETFIFINESSNIVHINY